MCLRLLFISLLIAGCHPKLKKQQRTQTPNQEPQGINFPSSIQPAGEELYHLANPSCIQTGLGADSIDNATVYKFVNETVKPSRHLFENTHSKTSLSGNAVSGTVFGHGERTKCELVAGELECSKKSEATSIAQGLKICKPDQTYKRHSFEGVALTSMSAIDLAYRYYSSLSGHQKNLPKSKLVVLPVIEQEVSFTDNRGVQREKSVYLTDNMAYMPSLKGESAFIVFPKGPFLKDLGIWEGLNLWESNWVIAHEFGHHVFMNHSKATSLDLQTVNLHNMKTHAPFKNVDTSAVRKATASSGKHAPYAAVNEGFADLFAFFSIQQRSEQINSLDCFRKSRDVKSAIFDSGVRKTLSQEVLDIFNGRKESVMSNSLGCSHPDFKDVHAIGSIIAHAVYDQIRLSPNFSKKLAQDKAFGELILSWATKLGESFGPKVSLLPSFDPLLKPLLLELKEIQGKETLIDTQCRSLKEKLPGIYPELSKGLCP